MLCFKVAEIIFFPSVINLILRLTVELENIIHFYRFLRNHCLRRIEVTLLSNPVAKIFRDKHIEVLRCAARQIDLTAGAV
jgi:hypothetical protein